ncbi:MAG: hypothetical protein GY795_41725, partial [Desulfobacterales bacterium]|nr:hypothetical protein [Desulfobacterales bacterium]
VIGFQSQELAEHGMLSDQIAALFSFDFDHVKIMELLSVPAVKGILKYSK